MAISCFSFLRLTRGQEHASEGTCSDCGGSIEYARQRLRVYRHKAEEPSMVSPFINQAESAATSLKILEAKLQSKPLGLADTESEGATTDTETVLAVEPQSDPESDDDGCDRGHPDSPSEKAFSNHSNFESDMKWSQSLAFGVHLVSL